MEKSVGRGPKQEAGIGRGAATSGRLSFRDQDLADKSQLVGSILAASDHGHRYLAGAAASLDCCWWLNLESGEFEIGYNTALLFELEPQVHSWSSRSIHKDKRMRPLYKRLLELGQQVFEQGDLVLNTGLQLTMPDGSERPFHFRGILSPKKQVAGIVLGGSPDKNEHDQELSFEMLQTALDSGRDLISIADPSGKCLYVSKSIEHLYGYTQEELISSGMFDFSHPEDIGEVQRLATLMSEGKNAVITVRVRHRDGRWLWVEVHGAPCTLSDGARIYVVHQWIVDQHHLNAEDARQKRQVLEEVVSEREAALEKARVAMQSVITAAQGIMDGLGAKTHEKLLYSIKDQIDATLAYPDDDPQRLRQCLGHVQDAVELLLNEDERSAERDPKLRRYRGLTPRESEVADLIVQGLVSKQIAFRLGITVASVNDHRKVIRKKLGLKGRSASLVNALALIKADL